MPNADRVALTPAEAFGQAIRELRHQLGASQEAVALDSGIDRSHFGHVERAAKSPTLTTIWKIADALGTRPSALLARTEELLDTSNGAP